MDESYKWFFYALVAWYLLMATFRHKQLMEVDQHMRGNMKEAAHGLGKGVKFGVGIVRFFLKK
jgi:choline-glycine betaine transporter